MDCHRCEDLLSLYLEDELDASGGDRDFIEDHLNSCTACAELYSFLSETQSALAGLPEIDISRDLKNRLYEIPVKRKKFSFGLDILNRPLVQPVLAGASIVLLLISFYVFHPDKNIIDKTINLEIHKGYSKIGQIYTKAESFAVALFDQKDTLLDSLKNAKIFRGKED